MQKQLFFIHRQATVLAKLKERKNMKSNKVENKTVSKASQLGFGFYDNKNREIGMTAVTWEFDLVSSAPIDLGCGAFSSSFPNMEQGHYFAVRTQATRNGEYFGASQQPKYFKTEKERDIYLAKRWGESLKKASNNK